MVEPLTLTLSNFAHEVLQAHGPVYFPYPSNTLMRLDDATVLYPGHNYAQKPTSTIGAERQQHLYVQCTSLHAFLHAMGH